jgi:hypothetical protein
MEVQIYAFLTWAVVQGEYSACPRRKEPRFSLKRDLYGLQSRSGQLREVRNLLFLAESQYDFLLVQPEV